MHCGRWLGCCRAHRSPSPSTPPSSAASSRCIIPAPPPSHQRPLCSPRPPLPPTNFSRSPSRAPRASLLISHHHWPLSRPLLSPPPPAPPPTPPIPLPALQPANTILVSPLLADKVRLMICGPIYQGCVLPAAATTVRMKGGGEGDGGGGEIFNLDGDTQRHARAFYFTCILRTGLLSKIIIFFSLRVLNCHPAERDQRKSKQCSVSLSSSG